MYTQLIYSSHATRPLDDDELDQILASAVSGNARRDITGLLLYTKGSFLQVLEGKAAEIDELLDLIRKDPRHDRIDILVRHPVRARDFSQWSMGFHRVRESDAAALPEFAACFENGFDAQKINAEPGLCLNIIKALVALKDAP
jgi:hypothetical protein